MSKQSKQSEKTKRLIIESAFKIIKENGVHGLSANKIVRQAGISKGGFFYHFPVIEELYISMLDELISILDSEMSPSRFSDFDEYMEVTTDFMFKFLDESPEIMTTILYFVSDSKNNEKYRKRISDMLDNSFEDWAEKISYFFHIDLDKESKDSIIRIMDIYFCGFSIHYLIYKDKERYRRITKDFISMVKGFINNGGKK